AASGIPTETPLRVLSNVIVPQPEHRHSRLALAPWDDNAKVDPFEEFISLPSPPKTPAPLDEGLTFIAESIPVASTVQPVCSFVREVTLQAQVDREPAEGYKLPQRQQDLTGLALVLNGLGTNSVKI